MSIALQCASYFAKLLIICAFCLVFVAKRSIFATL